MQDNLYFYTFLQFTMGNFIAKVSYKINNFYTELGDELKGSKHVAINLLIQIHAVEIKKGGDSKMSKAIRRKQAAAISCDKTTNLLEIQRVILPRVEQ